MRNNMKHTKADIYKITSPTGRIYIGSSFNALNRIKYYRKAGCETQILLYNSILKYGWEAHSFEIIEVCRVEDRNIRESYWGEYFDVLGENGLNCLLPKSETYQSISEETRQKMKNRVFPESHLEKLKQARLKRGPMTQESKDKIGKANKGNKSTTGRKGGEHQKNVMSILWKGKPKLPESIEKQKNSLRKIVLNTENGIYYDCSEHAAESLGYSKHSLKDMMHGRQGRKINTSPFIYA
jgi:group I intron endonuclease